MKRNIFIIFLCLLFSCLDNRQILLSEECKATILSILIDKNNHEAFTFRVRTRNEYSFFIADFYPKSWEYAVVGDSIIKNKGESFITIKKADGSFRVFETRIKK